MRGPHTRPAGGVQLPGNTDVKGTAPCDNFSTAQPLGQGPHRWAGLPHSPGFVSWGDLGSHPSSPCAYIDHTMNVMCIVEEHIARPDSTNANPGTLESIEKSEKAGVLQARMFNTSPVTFGAQVVGGNWRRS